MLKRLLVLLGVMLVATPSFAEVMTFEKEVEEVVANDQSREQVESFALQKAKRLAVEEAGTYISSLTVVANAMLQKDEITALASGVVQAKIIGLPNVRLENGVVHVNVKARIQVDTAILDKQVAELLKEKGTLKRLEDEQRKNRDLEQQLVNLKSTELKRLEELNAQAMAMEQERDRRRLANAEMALKAQGELKKAEIERLQKDRELNARTAKMMADQEQQRKNEAAALASEQDRIRRAQLENEQRWNDLARKSQLAQQQWVAIDDSLSLKQALEEARTIKSEIATLKQRSEFQYDESVRTLKTAYQKQIDVTTPNLPPNLAEKDPFESTSEYNSRVVAYENKVKAANEENAVKIEKLKNEEVFKLAQAKHEYLKQQIMVLRPFIERLKALQSRMFVLPGETVTVELGEPDADRNCFPVKIIFKSDNWTVDWMYTDRDKARDIYKTRAFLKAEAIVQLDGIAQEGYAMVAARVTHPGTGESQALSVAKPAVILEITNFESSANGTLVEADKEAATAARIARFGKHFKDPVTGMEFVFVPEDCFQMGSDKGDNDERPAHEICLSGYYIGKYEVTQGEWQRIMGNNPSQFRNCGADCPVENVSWNDAQQFINSLNKKSGMQYRLPSEAEWEYACSSGGKEDKYCGGSDVNALAWYDLNSSGRTHSVGQKQPNGLGLYDMSGNVWEWVWDWMDDYPRGRKYDPTGPSSGSYRVDRGGSWGSGDRLVRAVIRGRLDPASHSGSLGLRLVFPLSSVSPITEAGKSTARLAQSLDRPLSKSRRSRSK